MIADVLKSAIRPTLRLLPDEMMIKLQYRYHLGRKLNLLQPKTFNEKLQWLKLYDRKPEYTVYVDKYAVRKHVAETIGEKYLIPLIGIYDDVDDINWQALPEQFVLKCTHGSGFNIICRDKTRFDVATSRKKLKRWMKQNLFWYGREWAYKNVKPRIICEKYMADESGIQLKDYKISCFDGKPKFITVVYNMSGSRRGNLYDLQWNYIDVSCQLPNDPNVNIKRPEKLEEMLKLAEKLAKGFYQLRVDLYYADGNIYFGEMTLYDCSGYLKFNPEEFDKLLGSWIKLPDKALPD